MCLDTCHHCRGNLCVLFWSSSPFDEPAPQKALKMNHRWPLIFRVLAAFGRIYCWFIATLFSFEAFSHKHTSVQDTRTVPRMATRLSFLVKKESGTYQLVSAVKHVLWLLPYALLSSTFPLFPLIFSCVCNSLKCNKNLARFFLLCFTFHFYF